MSYAGHVSDGSRPYACRVTSGASIEVVAHRGANDEEPEHSLAAYLKAVEQGADAIECDVRLTADGTLVCVHDRRIDRTSTGRGTVSAMTLEELAAYDYSRSNETWIDYEDPPPDETRTTVLTLQTLLATMLEASTTVRFAIETKHPTRYGRYVEDSVAEMLRYFGLAHANGGEPRARVMSFSRAAVRRVHELLPGNPTVFLMDDVPRRYRDGSLPEGVTISGPSIEIVRAHPHYVEHVHARGGRVHVWTVDEQDDVDLCQSLGVDAIITNRPGRVLRILGR
jgi:glycerophosphoryl diester phosphodiesterase